MGIVPVPPPTSLWISLVSRLPIAVVFIVGFTHTCFVIAKFEQLGCPLETEEPLQSVSAEPIDGLGTWTSFRRHQPGAHNAEVSFYAFHIFGEYSLIYIRRWSSEGSIAFAHWQLGLEA